MKINSKISFRSNSLKTDRNKDVEIFFHENKSPKLDLKKLFYRDLALTHNKNKPKVEGAFNTLKTAKKGSPEWEKAKAIVKIHYLPAAVTATARIQKKSPKAQYFEPMELLSMANEITAEQLEHKIDFKKYEPAQIGEFLKQKLDWRIPQIMNRELAKRRVTSETAIKLQSDIARTEVEIRAKKKKQNKGKIAKNEEQYKVTDKEIAKALGRPLYKKAGGKISIEEARLANNLPSLDDNLKLNNERDSEPPTLKDYTKAKGYLTDEVIYKKQLMDTFKDSYKKHFPELDEREQDIFNRRIVKDKPDSLKEIGAEHNLSYERVRQIGVAAGKKLRTPIAEDFSKQLDEDVETLTEGKTDLLNF